MITRRSFLSQTGMTAVAACPAPRKTIVGSSSGAAATGSARRCRTAEARPRAGDENCRRDGDHSDDEAYGYGFPSAGRGRKCGLSGGSGRQAAHRFTDCDGSTPSAGCGRQAWPSSAETAHQYSLALRPHGRKRGAARCRRVHHCAGKNAREAFHAADGGDSRSYAFCGSGQRSAAADLSVDSEKLYYNNDEIDLKYMPNAHTDSDIFIYFVKANVLHTGDLWFNGMYPLIDASTGAPSTE